MQEPERPSSPPGQPPEPGAADDRPPQAMHSTGGFWSDIAGQALLIVALLLVLLLLVVPVWIVVAAIAVVLVARYGVRRLASR